MNKVMVQYSDDGGHTWSNEIWKDLVGDDKDYLTRVRFHNLGHSYNRIFRIAYAGDKSFTLISGHARISVGV